jgi:tocopherol cyclase
MLYLLKKLYQPEYFQGNLALRRHLRTRGRSAVRGSTGSGSAPATPQGSSTGPRGYFEGWYFKCVFPDRAYALIPGISLAAGDSHCFLQVVDGNTGTASYHRYPREEFRFGTDGFSVEVGPNRFSVREIHLELSGLGADLRIGDPVRWPSTPLSPSSMGWYAFARFMECYHGIIVLDAELEGTLGGRSLRGGRFYLEKDWGSSFPRAWIGMQSNSFGDAGGTSVTCSVARVPFRGTEFSGFIVGLLADGVLHRFTTYTGARIESLSVGEESLELRIVRERQTLILMARREPGVELASPVLGEMSGRIEETLGATIQVTLLEGGSERFAGVGRWAGLEVVRAQELLRGKEAIPR